MVDVEDRLLVDSFVDLCSSRSRSRFALDFRFSPRLFGLLAFDSPSTFDVVFDFGFDSRSRASRARSRFAPSPFPNRSSSRAICCFGLRVALAVAISSACSRSRSLRTLPLVPPLLAIFGPPCPCLNHTSRRAECTSEIGSKKTCLGREAKS